jgi:hypothetical protein
MAIEPRSYTLSKGHTEQAIPMQQCQVEAVKPEYCLADLLDQAYDLTPDDSFLLHGITHP